MCKEWRARIVPTTVPVCAVLPLPRELHGGLSAGHALFSSARTLVLALDEVRAEGQQDATADLHALHQVCPAVKSLKFLFRHAVDWMYGTTPLSPFCEGAGSFWMKKVRVMCCHLDLTFLHTHKSALSQFEGLTLPSASLLLFTAGTIEMKNNVDRHVGSCLH